jgi:hypothetical protein
MSPSSSCLGILILLYMNGTAGLFSVLPDRIVYDRFVSHFSAEVLHGFGVAVRAVVGTDAGA